ncbi:MAG: EAL domain-containing protein [Stenotrophomonas nitritireducens]|uniref:EAL domain-containing protein n=1 Tax=Stenotrophomonas nitritireducens TaxID=83617 RepID=UPI001ACE4E8B|nr:EAL domain-containing response regulator [Stenotrophomonas nitritireducens]MBN8791512.1 EAL domain-containing protein [Stenotrophomonas nitritireducens]MBN8795451.1 EAL domain-containing protein [Stenotrophomonas nitritireducens]
MASNDTPTSSARLSRAEVPPADYWQRWSVENAPPAEAVRAHIAAAPASPAAAPDQDPAAAETPYRVLIVEDDRSQALFAQSVLHGAGMQAIVQMEAEGVQQAIAEHRPDLILMDLHMPGLDGMRLTALIRQNPHQQLLPIVFLTGDPDPERQFEVLDSGADDFLTKPIRPRHLVAAVANRIRRSRQQSQGAAAGPALNNPETGLPTRHNLMLQLDAALAAAEPGGLMFIEIASALSLRERYGYAAFERLMMQAGRRLAEAGRPHLLARLNDNSFLLLARGMDEDAADALARSVRQALSAHPFLVREEESLHLRCAVGHAHLSQGFEDAGVALEAVERAALQARLVTDGVAAYQGSTDAAAQEHLALLEGQIELAYQPIVAVAGSDTAQYQVLLRLRRNDGTLLSAGQVIPAAEAAGRIADLDQQVLDHALGLLHRYQHAVPPMRLFVSQSLRTLAREAFADWLLKAIADRQIAGSALVIDVRLADALVHAVTLQQFCEKLMPAGVQFCLSQFEPGDEANALMTQLPLGFVRMAGRFAGSHGSQKLRDELRGAIDAAHRAGLQIIGQQIEDPQAAAAMWMSGIDFIQGNVVQSVGSELDFDFQNTVL